MEINFNKKIPVGKPFPTKKNKKAEQVIHELGEDMTLKYLKKQVQHSIDSGKHSLMFKKLRFFAILKAVSIYSILKQK